MSAYDFLMEKLKAMQIQGISRQKIFEEWLNNKASVHQTLLRQLQISILKDDATSIKETKIKIQKLARFGKVIQQGLMESETKVDNKPNL
jgi:hypothetical protein